MAARHNLHGLFGMRRTAGSDQARTWPEGRIWLGLACAGAILVAAGCKLPIGRGKYSKALVQSRQLTQQGLAELEHEHSREAEMLLARAVHTCDTDPEARRYYARALWRNNSRQEAVTQLTEAMRLAPDDQAIQRELAEFERAQGNFGDAQRLAESAIELDPHGAANWVTRAEVHEKKGDLKQALADYQRALGLDPNQPQVWMRVAEVYREMNQPGRALAALQTLREQYAPDEEPAHVFYLMGLASSALGRHDDAAASFQTARERGDTSPDLSYQLAEAQLLAGQTAEAEQTAAELVARAPDYVAGRMLLDRIRGNRAQAANPPLR